MTTTDAPTLAPPVDHHLGWLGPDEADALLTTLTAGLPWEQKSITM